MFILLERKQLSVLKVIATLVPNGCVDLPASAVIVITPWL